MKPCQSGSVNSEEFIHYKRVRNDRIGAGLGEGEGSRKRGVGGGLDWELSGSKGTSMIAHLNLISEGRRNETWVKLKW